MPEVLRAGPLLPLFKEYAREAWIDRHPVFLPSPPHVTSNDSVSSAQKVCFLVRVISPLHTDRRYENPNTHLLNKELELLITSKWK